MMIYVTSAEYGIIPSNFQTLFRKSDKEEKINLTK